MVLKAQSDFRLMCATPIMSSKTMESLRKTSLSSCMMTSPRTQGTCSSAEAITETEAELTACV